MTKKQIMERHRMQRQAKKAIVYYNPSFGTVSTYNNNYLNQRAAATTNNLLFSTVLLAWASTMFNR